MKTNSINFGGLPLAAGLLLSFAPQIYAAPAADPAKRNDPAEVESKQFQAKQEKKEEEAKAATAATKKTLKPRVTSSVFKKSFMTTLKFLSET